MCIRDSDKSLFRASRTAGTRMGRRQDKTFDLSLIHIYVLIESRERNASMSKELQIRSSTVDFLVFTRDAGEDGKMCIRDRYMPEQIKIADDILNYQKTKGKLHVIHKYYNSEEGKFCVKIKVVCCLLYTSRCV